MKENYGSKITLEILSKQVGLSPFYLQKIFKRLVGVSPRQYLEAIRLDHLKQGLKNGESVRRSTYSVGYDTSSWLYAEGRPKLGIGSSAFKYRGEGLLIYYETAACKLGRLLVAATSRGVCFVCIGESDLKSVKSLKIEFPEAEIQKVSTPGLSVWITKVLSYLQGDQDLKDVDLPLDVKATAFQWKVWRELQKIPYGTTNAYGEIAERIGIPTGSRAVANACASNPVALIIPCHRVIRKGGELGGYRWGLERKKQLIEMETHSRSNS